MDVERLPFDQFQRYRLVADLVEEVRDGRERLRVLDVGGRTARLREFLKGDRVELVDMEPSDAAGLVLGDGSRLPFKDGAFEVVAAFDTLEHVPPPRRADFVRECARVSAGHVFLAGPYRSPEVDEAEEIVMDFVTTKLRTRHRYLAEHREYGLPERAETERGLASSGLDVASIGHGNLDRWTALMCIEMYMLEDPILRPLAERLFKFYNASLYRSDHAPPVYRHVVAGARSGFALPDASRVLGAAGAPRESLPALLPFAQELIAFDRDLDVVKPELQRLHAVVESLEEDLAQRKLDRDIVAADLAGHRETVRELRAALEGERSANERIVSDAAADLAGHRATIDALREEVARYARTQAELASEIEVRGAALTAAREELERLHALRHILEADIAEHRQELARTGHALADRAARVDDLHAELTAALEQARETQRLLDGADAERAELVRLLRDRRKNLYRAFSPRKFADPRRGDRRDDRV